MSKGLRIYVHQCCNSQLELGIKTETQISVSLGRFLFKITVMDPDVLLE